MYVEPVQTLGPFSFVFNIVLYSETGFGTDVTDREVCLRIRATEMGGATVELAVSAVTVVVVRYGAVVHLCEGMKGILQIRKHNF